MTATLKIGARLRAARLRAGLEQDELGARAGLPAGTVAHYEADRRQPSLAHFRALCVALECAPAELLGLTERARPKYLLQVAR